MFQPPHQSPPPEGPYPQRPYSPHQIPQEHTPTRGISTQQMPPQQVPSQALPGQDDRALKRVVPVAALSRSSKPIRVLAQRLDLVRELGLRGARRYGRDMVSAARWAPAARRAVYRIIWEEAAQQVGARYGELGYDFTLLQRGAARTVAWFHNVQLDDPVTLRLALDKVVVHRLLESAGVPVPVHRQFTPADPAAGLSLVRESGDSFVVKPASGTSGGSGVTCAVDSVADFWRATLHAAREGERLLIERAVPGEEYRFLFLDGELLDVIRRRSTRVVGDGRSSVAELISKENARRASGNGRGGMSFLTVDLDCVLTLDQAGFSLCSGIPVGVDVPVKSAANENAPEDNYTVDRGLVADALIDEARRAACALGLRLAGVDLITPDISRSLADGGGAVIEVNGTPGLHYHYLVAEAERATRVAIPVLQTLLEGAPGR